MRLTTKKLPLLEKRIRLLVVTFIFGGLLIAGRLFFWQVVRGQELEYLGKNQQKTSQNVGASRGSILASDGAPLVTSSTGWLLWANPKEVKDPKKTAETLAPLLFEREKKFLTKEALASISAEVDVLGDQKTIEDEKTDEELIEAEEVRLLGLLTKDNQWIPLKHRLGNDKKTQIEALNLPGLGTEFEQRRAYPESSMAAHLLGFVGKDKSGADWGYFGLEGKYNLALSGVGGENIWEKDAVGNPIVGGSERKIQALDGVDLQTHIDRSIQHSIEKNLKNGIEKYGALEGTVIVMRPKDGAILGMASFPNYAPEDFSYFSERDLSNPGISQTFEPGSVFKVLVMAGALDAEAVKRQDRCDICTGSIKIGQYTIRTWDEKYHKDSGPAEIIKNSDNVGMVWAAQKLGKDLLYEYLANFGIGSPTGIDLQGETGPKLRTKGKWGDIDLATTSFGQGIAVTPIQMVRAVGAIANDGKIVTPQVIDKITGPGWEEDIKPSTAKTVIGKTARDEITEMMINAVAAGEAKWAAPKGFVIAGKTGTAQIPIQGHYDPDKTIASFIGFAPADKPQFVMLVTLKEPTSSPWASETAAPLWFTIAKDLFLHLKIAPTP
ncbi:MAG: hypothetical protein A3H88_01900 [Candidatus Blackburnbacteria bacterium RIFCSPLOWO2_02_FULL_44_9]|nr:MAG: hypothetical protein A3H88_01900 [Candidatus Blackburnbacteria bacterium RIFCSPLOWO2_02_FULL_44_9]